MSKFLNKYTRKFHRWLVLPFVVIMVIAMLTRIPVAQQVQQLMILTMVVTGVYLFLLPYWTKWQRQRRQRVSKAKGQ